MISKAMKIFVQWAEENDRNYFGDLVRENLKKYLEEGHTPMSAVEALIEKAP